LADPADSGILTVGSGMAGEFGGTPACCLIPIIARTIPAAFGPGNFGKCLSFIRMDRFRSCSPSAASMQYEFSVFDDDILNPARCLSKEHPRDPQFERTISGAPPRWLVKVQPSASTSAIEPPSSRDGMLNK
jgi:hypothetical protein